MVARPDCCHLLSSCPTC
uniref:Uncharacterized protein n=1 Tax=Arundo donax TaxID=35708 RepID=A0A0A9FFQ0_ARUDO